MYAPPFFYAVIRGRAAILIYYYFYFIFLQATAFIQVTGCGDFTACICAIVLIKSASNDEAFPRLNCNLSRVFSSEPFSLYILLFNIRLQMDHKIFGLANHALLFLAVYFAWLIASGLGLICDLSPLIMHVIWIELVFINWLGST
ncbi:hypothetical protein ACJX0J_019202 [Zea mays]